jgi:hypothetical protein
MAAGDIKSNSQRHIENLKSMASGNIAQDWHDENNIEMTASWRK